VVLVLVVGVVVVDVVGFVEGGSWREAVVGEFALRVEGRLVAFW